MQLYKYIVAFFGYFPLRIEFSFDLISVESFIVFHELLLWLIALFICLILFAYRHNIPPPDTARKGRVGWLKKKVLFLASYHYCEAVACTVISVYFCRAEVLDLVYPKGSSVFPCHGARLHKSCLVKVRIDADIDFFLFSAVYSHSIASVCYEYLLETRGIVWIM